MLEMSHKKELKVIKPKYYSYLKQKFPQMVPAEIARINLHLTVVEALNETVDDSRLDSSQGALQALEELIDYYIFLGDPRICIMNLEQNKQGEPQVFFRI